MKSKRIIALLLCFALTFSTAFGCGNKPDTPAPAEEVTKFTDTVMAQNGETDYKIVVPAAASDCVLYAAKRTQPLLYPIYRCANGNRRG